MTRSGLTANPANSARTAIEGRGSTDKFAETDAKTVFTAPMAGRITRLNVVIGRRRIGALATM